MRKKLLFRRLLLAIISALSITSTQAIVVPYLPPLQSFGGSSVNLTTFSPSTNDYTLEVQGTVGTPITIASSLYSYTPTSSGTVRFSQKKGIVYVYESNEYKTTLTPSYYPTITDANAASSSSNLLRNPSFETPGNLISGTTGTNGSTYKFGTPWTTNVTEASSGIRINCTTTGLANGTYVCVWRGSGNSNYFSQPILTSIKPNTTYKVIVRETAGGNATANFNFGIGSTASGMEYNSQLLNLGNGKTGTWSTILTTPSTVSATSYFTVKNTATNSASSGSDPVAQLDYLALIENVTTATPGISGVASATYLSGTAYAPENISINYSSGDYYDMASYITNASFEDSQTNATSTIPGWTNTGSMISNSTGTPSGWTKNGNVFVEKWIAGPGTLSAAALNQTISGIPNGNYRLTVSAHAIQQSNTSLVTTGAFVVAGAKTTAVNTGGTYIVDNVPVISGSLNIGYQLVAPITCNWTGFDNFKLYYLGPIIDPVISAPQTSLAFTTTTNSATIDLTGANLTDNISITVPSTNITLSGANVTGTSPNYTIALANANQLNSITATWDKALNVSGNISFTSGTAFKTVSVSSSDVESVAMSGITLSSGGLNIPFAVGTTSYNAKVPADITSTTVSAAVTPATIATVTNSGTAISASNPSITLTGNSYNNVNHTSGYTVNWGGNYTISDWSANGSSDATLSLPTIYGWSASPTITWVQANNTTTGTVRYMDMVNGVNAGIGGITYTYNSVNYDGRIMFVRWDGSASRVYSYPVYLESCKSYNLTSKAAYNSVASTGTITYKINTAKDNTGTNYATSTTTLSTAGVLVNANLSNISVPTTGVYYLTITSSQANLCAIADLNITENTTTSLNKSVSSLAFSTSAYQKSFTLTGNALSGDISLSAPTGITLDITTVTAGDAQCAKVITATWNKLANVTGNITINTAGLGELTIPITTDDVETSSIASVALSNGSLTTTFSSGTTAYSVKAPADISSITITGTTTSSAASITNNNGSVSSSNSLTLIGTSYNGLNTSNYNFTWGGNYSLTDWAANGDVTSTNASLPSTYGWKAINTTDHTVEPVWNNFGTQSNCRYRDVNSGYTYNGSDWSTTRALLIRWDGSSLTNRVFSYPLYLETGTTYQINGKVAWNSNGIAPTLTFSINTANDNSGTSYATSAIATGNSGQLKDINLRNISVPSNGVYYFTINSNTASLCAIEDLTINTQISENVSGDNSWSSATWSGGRTPLAGDDLTVTSGTLTIDQNASANTITVAPGAKVTLNNGVALNVGSILIQSDASGTATFVDADATGKTVNGTIQQYLPTGRNWYVGIPVSNGDNSITASSLTAGGATSVSYWDEPTGAWVNDYTGTLTKGMGYIAVSSGGTATNNISFTGTFNTGDLSVALTRTVGATKEGFNLIANPYPSYLNAMTAITNANSVTSTVEPTIWYRTKGSVYSFETVNTSSGVGTNGVTGYIPPMQAFWVRALSNTSLTFTNAMRYHANPSGVTTTVLKAPSNVQNSLVRIQVSNGTTSDETVIYSNANASNSFDNYDSRKMSNNSALVPEIYTTAGTEQLVINGLNEIPVNNEIPLGFNNLKTGLNSFTLRAAELRNLNTDTKVYLLDKSTNTETELTSTSAYTFSSDATNTTSRFSVIFKSVGQTTGTTNASDKKAIVYINSGHIIFVANEVPTGDNNSLMIFDAIGRKVVDRNITSSVTEINNINNAGIYVVRAVVNGQNYSAKINLTH